MQSLIKQLSTGLTEKEVKQAKKYLSLSVAENTKKAYSTDWKYFTEWCERRGDEYLPAKLETVYAYLLYMADDKGYSIATMERRLSSINVAHTLSGYTRPARIGDPHLKGTWSGIKREKGTRQKKKEPLRIEDIRLICTELDKSRKDLRESLMNLRDKAILLIGFSGGFRRSELAGIQFDHITFVNEGVKILVPKSKRDQEGKGLTKGIMYGDNPSTCPVRSIKTWLTKADIESGHVFRSINKAGEVSGNSITGHSIHRIVRKLCQYAGLDPEQYGGHSLRSGFCTEASRNGASEIRAMRHTGHSDRKTFEGYVHDGQLFENNPTSLLGL